jgi:hypothetical protein
MKRAMFFIGGVFWFLFAAGFAVFLFEYITQGAGLQFLGLTVSPGSVALGMVHVIGFLVAIVLCFSIGAGLCAHGIVREKDEKKPEDAASR